jgi:hypothetical protein
MNCTRDQFFPRARFACNERSGVAGSDGLHLFQHSFERLTLADDLLHVKNIANFSFKVELFLGELVA